MYSWNPNEIHFRVYAQRRDRVKATIDNALPCIAADVVQCCKTHNSKSLVPGGKATYFQLTILQFSFCSTTSW